jgi:hypothetical protein
MEVRMRGRSRLITAAAMLAIGLGTLAYYFYAVAIVQAYVGLFEALNPGQVQVGEPPLWFRALPYLGSLLLIGSAVLFLVPALSRRFPRSRAGI